ncbi:response regulator [Streptomyces sp. NPDC001604]|uniref:response regulator n=1 Tax=Streptomyces sp. NPDC001604 TaxID=3364593 RepID=UPI0036A4241D
MSPTTRPIRVLVADDHPVVRRGMTALLASLDGVEVVAEAATGQEAVREAQLKRPDVVVMDIQMPAMDGVEATRRLTALLPDVAVLVVTMFEDDATVVSAMRAGARGYLLKGAQQEEILTTIRSVAAGQFVIGPAIAARLLGHLDPAPVPAVPFPDLTTREREVLELIAQGHTRTRVAADLALADKTVRNHLTAIFAKLGVRDRTEAAILAREQGLGGGTPGSGP